MFFLCSVFVVLVAVGSTALYTLALQTERSCFERKLGGILGGAIVVRDQFWKGEVLHGCRGHRC
jgi:hypothetical protein